MSDIEQLKAALERSMAQWSMYYSDRNSDDLETAKHMEGDLFRQCQSALKLKFEWVLWNKVYSHPQTDLWLWWNGETTFPVNIMRDAGGKMFASLGQWGWTRAQFLDEMGGLWSPFIVPEPPKALTDNFQEATK